MPLGATIPEGHRNSHLSHFAGRVLKRLGDIEVPKKNRAASRALESKKGNSAWSRFFMSL